MPSIRCDGGSRSLHLTSTWTCQRLCTTRRCLPSPAEGHPLTGRELHDSAERERDASSRGRATWRCTGTHNRDCFHTATLTTNSPSFTFRTQNGISSGLSSCWPYL